MQRRLFIILGAILALLAVMGFLYVFIQQQQGDTPAPAEQEPTAIVVQEEGEEPVDLVDVIVAVQPIARGDEIPQEALGVIQMPERPPNAIQSQSEVIGKVAKLQIEQGLPILRDFLQDKTAGLTGEAAFDIPPGHVMVAFPIDKQSSVAYALQAGDIVDVLMTFSIIDLDTDFQTMLPNKFTFMLQDMGENADGEQIVLSTTIDPNAAFDEGRLKIENEEFPGYVFPREDQRPRRVAQLTVQRGKVIRVGPWIDIQPAPVVQEEGAPPPTPALPDVVSIAVTPQDALVLLWARQTKVYMELALRAAGDEVADHTTEAVTLQYMLTRFNISVPPKLEFGIDKSDLTETTVNTGPAPAPVEPAN